MAKQQKVRVKVGVLDNGAPDYRWATGMSTEELHDSIVRVYIETGLIQKLLEDVAAQPQPEQTGYRFGEYAMKWFEAFKVPKLRETTLSGYRSNLRKHIIPYFGEMFIAEIMTSDVQDWLNERANLGKNTLHTMLVLLAEILDGAIEDKLVDTNPARSKRIINPSSKAAKRHALTLEQAQSVLKKIVALPSLQRMYMAVLLFTGMRRGEVLGLRWEDIDFERKIIHVTRAVSFPTNQPLLGPPKSDNGIRDIPLDDQLVELLQPIQAEGYIIGGDAPLTLTVYRNRFEVVREQIDLYGATAHNFRHTYLTMLDKAGVRPTVIKSIGGHSNIKTTMGYVHTQEDDLLDAGTKVGNLLAVS